MRSETRDVQVEAPRETGGGWPNHLDPVAGLFKKPLGGADGWQGHISQSQRVCEVSTMSLKTAATRGVVLHQTANRLQHRKREDSTLPVVRQTSRPSAPARRVSSSLMDSCVSLTVLHCFDVTLPFEMLRKCRKDQSNIHKLDHRPKFLV